MKHLILSVINISITASILVAVILALRLLFKKAPKSLICVLWGFVAIRLIVPVFPESRFSLMPATLTKADRTLSDADALSGNDSSYIESPFFTKPADVFQAPDMTIPSDSFDTPASDSPAVLSEEPLPSGTAQLIGALTDTTSPATVKALQPDIFLIATVLWAAGVFGMLLYAGISYLRIHKKVREAVLLYDNIWLCDHVDTPFILGIFRPRIFLPSSIQPSEMKHVVAHEEAHLKRLDHIWKPFGYGLLSVYWFNPMLWIAYLFLCKDIELACDEQVIRRMSPEDIKSYSSTLLNYSVSRKMISVCPLAFGEVNVKKRIKNALNYKKPAFWIIAAAVISCAVVAVCFLTNPIPSGSEKETTGAEQNEEITFLSMTLSETGSDIPGIQIKPEPYAFFTGNTLTDISLQIQWMNNNYNSDLLYGESFDVLYYENDTWNSCATKEHIFPAIAHSLPKKSEETKIYSLNDFDFSKEGLYRFQAEPAPGQYLWFDFEVAIVREGAPDTLTDSTLLSVLNAISKDKVEINSMISDYPELYDLLLSGGETTVNCFLRELVTAKDYGIREYLMASICSQLTGVGLEEGEYNPDTWWATADQWLEIYKKHLAEQITAANTTADSSEVSGNTLEIFGTYAEWKVSKELYSTIPKTPVPRPLVWVNYCYNPVKNPGGLIKVELPEFPGITFYANSSEIYAYTEEGIQTLIRGETIWTTYLADLNNDSFPEFCATISSEQNNQALEIMIYDFANKKSYGISDLKQYDYALFGDSDTMYVSKTDRNTKETVLIGELAITGSPENNGTALELTEVPEVLSRSISAPDSMLDLLGYSNLYGDYVAGKNRWRSNDYCTLRYIYTQEDLDEFLSTYSSVRIWTKNGNYSINDDFVRENVLSPNTYSMEGFRPTIVLTTHELTQVWYLLHIPEEA
ncbi:MAG: M56 family metallopeptidase [Lachnospiraceae bacterium]|nr:M56 family metallopeptidase [Lachnospiraceae bacterium]